MEFLIDCRFVDGGLQNALEGVKAAITCQAAIDEIRNAQTGGFVLTAASTDFFYDQFREIFNLGVCQSPESGPPDLTIYIQGIRGIGIVGGPKDGQTVSHKRGLVGHGEISFVSLYTGIAQ